MLRLYVPGSYGMYSTLQLPSLLSVQDILASDGPSIARPRPPVPAPLEREGWTLNTTSRKHFLGMLLPPKHFVLPGFNSELVGLVGDAAFQARTMHANTSWIAAFSYGNTEWTFRHWRAIVANFNTVWAWSKDASLGPSDSGSIWHMQPLWNSPSS